MIVIFLICREITPHILVYQLLHIVCIDFVLHHKLQNCIDQQDALRQVHCAGLTEYRSAHLFTKLLHFCFA